jgi:hypothetical protein
MTIDPVLMCVHCGKPTLHLFVERRTHRPVPKDEPFDDFVYACDECGEQRRWGNQLRDADVSRRREQSIVTHAVEVHGLRRVLCPVCGGIGRGCDRCRGEGELVSLEDPDPCGAGCPLDRHEREGTC